MDIRNPEILDLIERYDGEVIPGEGNKISIKFKDKSKLKLFMEAFNALAKRDGITVMREGNNE